MIFNWRSNLHDFDINHLSACFSFEKRMEMSVSVMRKRVFFEMREGVEFYGGDDVFVVQYAVENGLGLPMFQWSNSVIHYTYLVSSHNGVKTHFRRKQDIEGEERAGGEVQNQNTHRNSCRSRIN